MVIREILLYEFQLDHSAKEAFENICKTKDDNAVKLRNAYLQFSKFKNRFFNLKDESRTGRPRSFEATVFKNATESNPSTSVRCLSAELGPFKIQILNQVYTEG